MALVKCKECGKEISNKAAECPYCGCLEPASKPWSWKKATLIGIIIVILMFGFVILTSDNDSSNTPKSYTYKVDVYEY